MRRCNKGLCVGGFIGADNHHKTPGLHVSHNNRTPRGLSEAFSMTLDRDGPTLGCARSHQVVTIMKVCL